MIQERNASLDNLKGILIISVVYVHFYDMFGDKTPLLFTLRTIVLAVQMPLFMFLSGYFGKNLEKRRRAAWTEYLVPFLILNSCYYLVRANQVPLKYGLFRPQNMYWFLMSLLIIRLLMPELVRIRWLLPVSIVLALLAGGDSGFGRMLSLSRTVGFLPFYLMGYYCTPEHMKRMRRLPLPVAWLSGLTGAFLALWLTDAIPWNQDKSHPFQLVNTYRRQQLNPWQGMSFRLGIYIAAPLLGMLLIRLMSARKNELTAIGRGSMTVYLLHAFPMLWCVKNWEKIWGLVCKWMPLIGYTAHVGRLLAGIPQLLILCGYSYFIAWLFSRKPIVRTYEQFNRELQRLIFQWKSTSSS